MKGHDASCDKISAQCCTYSIEFIGHLHQLLVHLDANVLALKDNKTAKHQIAFYTNIPSKKDTFTLKI